MVWKVVVQGRNSSPGRMVGCTMARCGAALICMVGVVLLLPQLVSSLKVIHLPGNSVRLLRSIPVLFHTDDDHRLTFFAVSDVPQCWFNENYRMNVRETVGGNPDLIDPSGRQWYELSYLTFQSSLIVKIRGKKDHFVHRRWKVDDKCKKGLVFTFISRNVYLGARWDKTLVDYFPESSNNISKSEFDLMELQYIKRLFHSNESERLYIFERGESLNRLLKDSKPIRSIYDYLPRTSTEEGGIVILHNLTYVFTVVSFIVVMLFCMRCCFSSMNKKMPEHVKTVTIVRRIPIVESGSSSPLVAVREEESDDLPPSYDDIEVDTTSSSSSSSPPPYSDVQSVQVLVGEMSCLAQPCSGIIDQGDPEEAASFVALEILPPQQLADITGEVIPPPAALLVPVLAEEASPSQSSPIKAETAPPAQSFPISTA